jgi:hypothetical protein
MTANLTNLAALYKTLYPQGVPYDETYKDFPFLSMMKRNEGFYGDSMKVPVKYGNNTGRSSTFSNAQANQSSTKNIAFFVTRAKDYSIANIDHETMEASETNPGAFVKTFQHEVEGAMGAAVSSEAQSLAGDGSGIIGAFAGSVVVGTAVALLSDIEQVVNFEVGQTVELSSGGVLRAGSLLIAGIDRGAGIITFSGNITAGVAAAAAGDSINIQGDFNLKPKGFTAWIPNSAPSATPFFGVDRTPDITRLSGIREDLSALPIEEALVKALKLLSREGSKADYAFLNYEKFAELENSLGSKVQYVDVESPIGIGFRGIKVFSGKMPVTVLADQTVPSNKLWIAQMNTWELASLKKSIRILDQDGNKALRLATEDAEQIRIGGYKQFVCYAPGWNGNFSV